MSDNYYFGGSLPEGVGSLQSMMQIAICDCHNFSAILRSHFSSEREVLLGGW